ncbi:Formin-like protein [Actinidia chinensis var. chinensis]|uniref:Formin-like protein n=1 Tax=Actinidia chinensis var. chinensis TaxID=1590841 RepID=A0A2R6QDD7_ACTCC|nr:Formin-like protein [Actinidia chinensis var. chinensis]
MGSRRVLCLFALALVFFDLAECEGNRRADELLLDNQFYSALGELNGDLAEQLWLHCGVELINAKEAVEDMGFYGPEEKSSINNEIISNTFLAKEDIQKAICVLHPEVKQTLLDCLIKKNLQLFALEEENGFKNCYTKYLDFFFGGNDAPRRRHLLQSPAQAPTPSPTSGSPIFSPSPSPDPLPSSPQVPDSPPSAESPLPPFFPPNFSGSDLQPVAGGKSSATPNSATNVQSNKQNSSHKPVVIAVAVTAAVTFFFATLLFFCYCRVCRNGGGVGRNDERPLLSLNLSDYSVGSSHKSFALGGSINNGKLDSQSFNTGLNDNKTNSSLKGKFYVGSDVLSTSKADTQSLGAIAGAAKISAVDSSQISHSTLKPPPGRLGNPPGLPPLKPPPGKEPRPPLPPPIPPPSLKPTSSSPRPPPPGPPRPPPPGPPLPLISSGVKTGPRPPPPPKSGGPPPRPPAMGSKPLRPPPLGSNHPPNPIGEGSEADASKTKLKPFFWDKVLANPDQSMVWHQIKSGSFQFSEEMIETLFGYAPPEKNKKESKKESSSQDPPTQYIQIIDSKKAQNLSILLRALNVTTEEVCDALQEGNELPSELLQTLLKMAPTTEEELKLRLFSGELSRLGPADRFLKVLVDIPFAVKRLESLLFMSTFQEEISIIKDSFITLEASCTELRKSRLFLKLLEAVLKTGNRMNDGTFRGGAQAFKLDTLLKLADVKGTDGKTTLLHFVVQEIIRSEGVRAARAARESRSLSGIRSDDLLEETPHDSEEHYRSLGLHVVSGLSNELENVKKAAVLDTDSLTGAVAKLGHQLVKSRDFLNSDMKNVDEENGFHQALKSFVQNAEVDIMSILDEEKKIMALVKSTAGYFHGNAGKDEGLRLFVIVRDFLIVLDKACKDVKDAQRKPYKTPSKEVSTAKPPSEPRQSPDPRQWLFPAIQERRMDDYSSDDENP